MIRDAAQGDIEHIVALGARMAEKANLATGFDPDSVRATLAHLIDNPEGILLVSDVGMIGGICFNHPFNFGKRCFQEMFWYSEGGDGPDLLEMAQAQAKARGVEIFGMFSQFSMRPKAVNRFYERAGFVAETTGYIKEI